MPAPPFRPTGGGSGRGARQLQCLVRKWVIHPPQHKPVARRRQGNFAARPTSSSDLTSGVPRSTMRSEQPDDLVRRRPVRCGGVSRGGTFAQRSRSRPSERRFALRASRLRAPAEGALLVCPWGRSKRPRPDRRGARRRRPIGRSGARIVILNSHSSFANRNLPNDLVLSRGAASAAASNYLCPSRGAGGCSDEMDSSRD